LARQSEYIASIGSASVLMNSRFFGPLVEEQMKAAANDVVISEVFENCGHSLSLEQPERLANLLKKFVL
jgi:pimeloyl-ACP methyl ester carboxylesterase